MALILPNSIANGQPVDGDKLEQNFDTIANWGNSAVVNSDGSVAMTGQLLLPGNPTQPKQAATKEYVDDTIPIGAFFMWGGATPPNVNYLLCQGQAVSRATYAKLFAVFGVLYGAGDGVTTFALPQMRGRIPMGYYPSGAWAATLGMSFGTPDAVVPTHTHPMPHTHTFSDTSSSTSSAGTHSHELRGVGDTTSPGGLGEGNIADYSLSTFTQLRTSSTAGAHSHTVSVSGTTAAASTANTSSTGVSATNANIPPIIVTNFIVKAL